MKTSQNTILITGGGSGIGFEMARLFASNNKVIITGRGKDRLEAAVSQIPGSSFIQADVTHADDVDRLVRTVKKDFPSLNVLVNNAANAQYYSLAAPGADAYAKAGEEILTNYLSVIRLTEKLLPVLRQNGNAAVVNVSSIVAFAPGISLPTYAASKAALHSYSQSLRLTLERNADDIRVFELMPPLVNTEFSRIIGGENGMPAPDVAKALADGLANDTFEIHPGMTAGLYQVFLNSPAAALNALNSR